MLPVNKTVGGTKGTMCFAAVVSVHINHLIFTCSEESFYSNILQVNVNVE